MKKKLSSYERYERTLEMYDRAPPDEGAGVLLSMVTLMTFASVGYLVYKTPEMLNPNYMKGP